MKKTAGNIGEFLSTGLCLLAMTAVMVAYLGSAGLIQGAGGGGGHTDPAGGNHSLAGELWGAYLAADKGETGECI